MESKPNLSRNLILQAVNYMTIMSSRWNEEESRRPTSEDRYEDEVSGTFQFSFLPFIRLFLLILLHFSLFVSSVRFLLFKVYVWWCERGWWRLIERGFERMGERWLNSECFRVWVNDLSPRNDWEMMNYIGTKGINKVNYVRLDQVKFGYELITPEIIDNRQD